MLAYSGIIPPKEWYHNPELQDEYNWTTAMFIAYICKCIPDE